MGRPMKKTKHTLIAAVAIVLLTLAPATAETAACRALVEADSTSALVKTTEAWEDPQSECIEDLGGSRVCTHPGVRPDLLAEHVTVVRDAGGEVIQFLTTPQATSPTGETIVMIYVLPPSSPERK